MLAKLLVAKLCDYYLYGFQMPRYSQSIDSCDVLTMSSNLSSIGLQTKGACPNYYWKNEHHCDVGGGGGGVQGFSF